MKDLLEIVKIILPSLIMLAAVYYIVGGFLRNSEKRRTQKAIRGNQKLITPLRLQAHERLALFLERITPELLVMRANYSDKTCEQLYTELVQTIRAEYEHNLSQQIYVSIEAWKSVKNAKNYTIALINNAAKDMDNDAPAIVLSRKILEMAMELDQAVSEKAINELKRDIQQIF